MDTNALKKFAQSARNLLIDQVRAKLDLVLASGSAARREHPAAMDELDKAVFVHGKDQVIEQVAYTWFNRFSALRFMDANGYTSTGIVSPAAGQTRPEILAEAMAGNIPDGAPSAVAGILDGTVPSSDAQAEAYRLLLVHACNQWHAPMPFLFEKLDDFSELLMPEDLLSQASILAEMRKVMTDDACQDVEIIGWLYQFYISEKKDQVFAGLKKNQKITAENIPAATQLFTPHWIVRYLVENSLGRLWLLNRPSSKLASQMDYYIAPEEPETDFLRISKPEEIKICDPACGSGHMLTYAFDLLYAIYEEEGYEPTEIPGLILTHNLHGIEIDDRAGALAAFALSMKAAAKLGRRRFLKLEAKPNICVLQNVHFTAAEMQDVLAVVGSDLFTNDFRETMRQFEQAKNFGSLIVPKLRDPAEVARLVKLKDFSRDLLLREVQARVLQVLEMSEALASKYHVVVANPPYMGAKNMNSYLSDFIKSAFLEYKSDIFSAFIVRCADMANNNGQIGFMSPFVWMFISSYEELRFLITESYNLRSLVQLEYSGFDGAVVPICAFLVEKSQRTKSKSVFIRLEDFKGKENQGPRTLEAIANPNSPWRFEVNSREFTKIPGRPISYWLSDKFRNIFSENHPLDEVFFSDGLTKTGDNSKYLRFHWEVEKSSADDNNKYRPCAKGGEPRKYCGNMDYIIKWKIQDRDHYRKDYVARISPEYLWERSGITWTKITSNLPTFRKLEEGSISETGGPAIFLRDGQCDDTTIATLAFLSSKPCGRIFKILNPTMNFQSNEALRLPMVKNVPLDVIDRTKRLMEISQADWDMLETSKGYLKSPLISLSRRDAPLEQALSTYEDFCRDLTEEFSYNERVNNEYFIRELGIEDEMTPHVPDSEITIFSNLKYRYRAKSGCNDLKPFFRADTVADFLSYSVGCMFGRYSLDESGLILANQGETLADYLARVPAPTFMPDEDNVIPVLDGDWFADDVTERFRLFLRVTFGDEHFQENLKFIEDSLGKDIRRYFLKDFYADHVKRYKKRPIYWMFSSPKGTFNALIYMHRYRPDTVSILLNDYLREFISKLEGERGRLEKLSDDPGASQSQRTKALKDMGVVAKQIDELNEWERDVIFPLAQAKIEIDLDDGVKANYPKFGIALKRIPGLEEKDD